MDQQLKDKITNAFSDIQAEDSLLQATQKAIYEKPKKRKNYIPRVAAAVCVMFCFCIVSWNYHIANVQAAALQVEAGKASVCLNLNKKNQVISMEGLNEEGNALVEDLGEQRECHYEEVLEKINGSSTVDVIQGEEESVERLKIELEEYSETCNEEVQCKWKEDTIENSSGQVDMEVEETRHHQRHRRQHHSNTGGN